MFELRMFEWVRGRRGARGAHALPVLFLLALFTLHSSLFADADYGFSYQAEIRDGNGAVIVDDTGKVVHEHTVEIRLYSTPTGGEALWGHSYKVYTDDNGFFITYLSDSTGAPLDSLAEKYIADVVRVHAPGGLYIGLTVGGGTEILPRQRLCATPYATVANNLVSGADLRCSLTVNGDLTVNGKLKAKSIIVDGYSELFSVPIGSILPWANKKYAPDGAKWKDNGLSTNGMWAICNGSNTTPDLRGRFVVGASGSYPALAKGGEEKVWLVDENGFPAHAHGMTYSQKCADRRIYMEAVGEVFKEKTNYGAGLVIPSMGWVGHGPDDSWKIWSWTIESDTDPAGGKSTGGVDGHENRPPYYAIYFIMRVK